MSGGHLCVDLWAPGMTILHRAGLGGLWMTLEQIEKDCKQRNQLQLYGSWTKDARSVTFEWQEGEHERFFNTLFELAYPIHNGLICFCAYGDPYAQIEHTLMVHEVMLQTFLQHPKSRKAEKKSQLTLDVDGVPQSFKYQRVTGHRFRDAPFSPYKPGQVKGWLFPGGTERHAGLGGSTALVESPERLLALRFGPVGCVFYQVRRYQPGVKWKSSFAVGIPELDNLVDFAAVRRLGIGCKRGDLTTAGPNDAAARLFLLDAGAKTVRCIQPRRCTVVEFERAAWSQQQSTRSKISRVYAPDQQRSLVDVYDRIRRALPVQSREKNGESWLAVPQVPELAATNLLAGRPWWQGFGEFAGARAADAYRYEKGGLQKIVKDVDVMPDGPERKFVFACQEAWHRRLGELGERAKREGLDFSKLCDGEYEKLRIRFAQSKTVDNFRAAIADFWARARGGPILRSSWADILPFLGEGRWREGRDLALLSLASYAKSEAGDDESEKEDVL